VAPWLGIATRLCSWSVRLLRGERQGQLKLRRWSTGLMLGSSLATSDAGGLSSWVAADDQAIVTWPDTNGGVDVVLRT